MYQQIGIARSTSYCRENRRFSDPRTIKFRRKIKAQKIIVIYAKVNRIKSSFYNNFYGSQQTIPTLVNTSINFLEKFKRTIFTRSYWAIRNRCKFQEGHIYFFLQVLLPSYNCNVYIFYTCTAQQLSIMSKVISCPWTIIRYIRPMNFWWFKF